MANDPMLEAAYRRAQECERKRVIEQAAFDNIRAHPVKANTRCGSTNHGVQCGYPAGHKWPHGSGRTGDGERW